MSIADITKLVYFTTIVLWILPAFRQYKGKYFDFFLILAVIDPISVIYGLVTKTSVPLWLYNFFTYLLIVSIMSEDFLKKVKYILIAVPVIYVFFIPFLNVKHFHIVLIIEHTFLFLSFLKPLITFFVETKSIKMFSFMLVFYELTVILKFFNLLIGFADAFTFFIFTGITQIIFGLFFSIFREDESASAL